MKKFILAGAVVALMIPSASFAQEANTGAMEGAASTGTMESGTSTGGAMESGASTGGAMGAGKASATSDTTGSYTIVTRTSANAEGTSSGQDANKNTDPSAVMDTINANPGLAEKLKAEGIDMNNIGSISVEPNGQVVVFSKS